MALYYVKIGFRILTTLFTKTAFYKTKFIKVVVFSKHTQQIGSEMTRNFPVSGHFCSMIFTRKALFNTTVDFRSRRFAFRGQSGSLLGASNACGVSHDLLIPQDID